MSVGEPQKQSQENPMLEQRIEKVTVNIAIGKSGEPLERAMQVLQELTGQKPCRNLAKKTIRDFGIRKGEPIACMVTLRKQKAIDFLKKVLPAVDNKISRGAFDVKGNFSFGIKEHIDIPGTRYVPELGIFGMNVAVAVSRTGHRVQKRRRIKSRVGKKHLLTPEESVQFVKEELGVEIV